MARLLLTFFALLGFYILFTFFFSEDDSTTIARETSSPSQDQDFYERMQESVKSQKERKAAPKQQGIQIAQPPQELQKYAWNAKQERKPSKKTEATKTEGTKKEKGNLQALSKTIGSLFEESTSSPAPSPVSQSEEIKARVTINQDDQEERPSRRSGGGPPQPIDLNELATPIPTISPTPTPTPTPEYQWVTGQARGYTMLYAMQPEARLTAEAELQNMLDARVRDLYLGVLIDGTFSWNREYLASLIRRLNVDDRRLTLALFITNGATMRRFDTTPIITDFSRIDPIIFREKIQFDPITRDTYLRLARRSLPLFALNRQLSQRNNNIVIPMLEDNLDRESYRAISALTTQVIGTLAEVVRNPCPGRYEGNDMERFEGALELHGITDLLQGAVGDSFSLDGTGYHLPNEQPFLNSLSFKDLVSTIDTGLSYDLRYFGLWRADRQGLLGTASVHPRERIYAIPTEEHLELERELLRHGLREENIIP